MRPVSPEDLTARARLREAALHLFARDGFRGASVRAIAAAAGVSPALVRHHFGTKEGLRNAVDESVLDSIGAALADVDRGGGTDELITALGRETARLFGADKELRAYLRRALLDESEASEALYARLLDGARAEVDRLSRAGVLRDDADREWAPFQLLLLTLGPLLLEPLLQSTVEYDAFAADALARRSAANQRLLLHGLLRESTDPA